MIEVDKLIMNAVFKSEKTNPVSQKYIVGTGYWIMTEDDGETYISFTDDMFNEDKCFSVLILDDCEMVLGEKLVMYTSAAMGDKEFSLILFKTKALPLEDLFEEYIAEED